jgi:hypothetical protein
VLRDIAMAQLSDLIRATRGQAAEPAFIVRPSHMLRLSIPTTGWCTQAHANALVLQLETGKINCVRLPRYGRLPLGGACNNARIPNWFARSERGILRVLDQQRSTDRHKELMSDFPLLKGCEMAAHRAAH